MQLFLFVTDRFFSDERGIKIETTFRGRLSTGEMKAGGTLSHGSASVLMAGDYQEEVGKPAGMTEKLVLLYSWVTFQLINLE